MIIHTFLGIILTILVGLITGMIIEMSLITITSALFKRYTGGVHASTPEICLIIGIILSLILSTVCRFISINIDINNIVLIGMTIIAFSYYMIYYKCPVPSKNKPLNNEKTRNKLRKKAFTLLNIYIILIIILYIIYYILEKIKYPYSFKYQQREVILKNIKFKAITWNDFERERIGYHNFMEISGNEVEKVKPILEIIKKYELQGECKGKIMKKQ